MSHDITNLGDTESTFRTEVRDNNETVMLYPNHPDGGKYGIVRHKYDGFPARGVVDHDVTDVTLEGLTLPDDERPDGKSDGDVLTHWHDDYLEWAHDELLTNKRSNVYVEYVDTHTFEIKNPYEGDVLTVTLDTTNKRRLY